MPTKIKKCVYCVHIVTCIMLAVLFFSSCGGSNSGAGDGDGSGDGAGGEAASVTPAIDCSSHMLALKSDGTVWAWGADSYGQLGDGTMTYDRNTPVQVHGPDNEGFLTNVTAISAGGSYSGFSLALKEDGTLWAWGDNDVGQLGDGTTTDRNTPVQVLGPNGGGFLTDIIAVSAGDHHVLALKNDGTVWAWGKNINYALGDGTHTDRYTPVQVLGPSGEGFLTNMVAILASYKSSGGEGDISFAVKSDGTAWSWGGVTDPNDPLFPTQIEEFSNAVSIAYDGLYETVLKSDGTVWQSILGEEKQVAITDVITIVIAIDSSEGYAYALRSDGTVWRLAGAGTSMQVDGLEDVIDIGASGPCAVKNDGTVWTLGNNSYGQRGNGTTGDETSGGPPGAEPVEVEGLNLLE